MPYKDPEVARAKKHAYYLAHRAESLALSAQWRKEHPEQARAIVRKSKHKHAEKVRAYNRAYNKAHPEVYRASNKRHRAAHLEEDKARQQRNRLKRREQISAYNAAYQQAHPERHLAAVNRRRARLHGADATLTHEQWLLIKAHQDHCCAYCGKRCKGHLTQDHILALSKGGAHTLHNVIGACKSCNSRKHVGPPLIPVQPLLL